MSAPTRWWAAPVGKTELDAVEKAMLAPTGQDRRYDLGGVLLAAHRAGAGACRQAASLPLLDERGLVSALAEARVCLGIPMAEAVAKCVGGGPEAMLLTRDLLDDADAAALDLFRTAVAKGVPAPTAALRVGDVYGADTRALGKYRTLALDPKANPVALTDTADRVLFSYIQDVCNNELPETPVVSKATIAQERAREEATRRTYVRDDEGRFAAVGGQGAVARMRQRLGIGATSIPRVSDVRPTEQEQQAPAGPTAREVLAVRQLRRQRAKARRERALARAETETETTAPASAPAPAEPEVATRTGARTRTIARTRTGLFSRQLLEQAAAKDAALHAPSRVRANKIVATPEQLRAISASEPIAQQILGDRWDSGLNARDPRYPDDYAFVKVPGMVQIVLDKETSDALNIAAQETPEKIFRMKALRDRSKQPPVISNADPLDPGMAAAELREAMDATVQPHPDIWSGSLVTPEMLERSHSMLPKLSDKLDAEINKYLSDKGWGPERAGFAERKFAVSMAPAHNANGWYLVDQWSEDDGQAVPYDEQPKVFVYTLPAGYAEGEDENIPATGYTRQAREGDWTLNPNQSLKVRTDIRDPSPGEWHSKGKGNLGGYWVKTVELEPVSAEDWKTIKLRAAWPPDEANDVTGFYPPKGPKSAALSTAERSELVETEPRDETGQWVARGALERLRERMATEQDQKKQVAAVRALRTSRRSARRLRQATAVPAEAAQEGAIATQEGAVEMQRTQARARTRKRTRTVNRQMATVLDNPVRIKAQEAANAALKVDLQRRAAKPKKGDLEWHGPRPKVVAVPKATYSHAHPGLPRSTPERLPFTFDKLSNHVIMTADDFEDFVREAPNKDEYRIALSDELAQAFGGMVSGDNVVTEHIKAAHHADYSAEDTRLDREDIEFAGSEAEVRQQMRGILKNTGASVVEARQLRAHDKDVDTPSNLWQLSYDQHAPRDPIYAIRVPEDKLYIIGEHAELHRMAGPPQYLEEREIGSVREGYLRERSIPVVTYELTAPSPFVETFEPETELPEWGQREVTERKRRLEPEAEE